MQNISRSESFGRFVLIVLSRKELNVPNLRSCCLIYILCKHQCVVSALISNWGRTDALAVSSDGAPHCLKNWENPWKF